jgi:hypothetical protein
MTLDSQYYFRPNKRSNSHAIFSMPPERDIGHTPAVTAQGTPHTPSATARVIRFDTRFSNGSGR